MCACACMCVRMCEHGVNVCACVCVCGERTQNHTPTPSRVSQKSDSVIFATAAPTEDWLHIRALVTLEHLRGGGDKEFPARTSEHKGPNWNPYSATYWLGNMGKTTLPRLCFLFLHNGNDLWPNVVQQRRRANKVMSTQHQAQEQRVGQKARYIFSTQWL